MVLDFSGHQQHDDSGGSGFMQTQNINDTWYVILGRPHMNHKLINCVNFMKNISAQYVKSISVHGFVYGQQQQQKYLFIIVLKDIYI